MWRTTRALLAAAAVVAAVGLAPPGAAAAPALVPVGEFDAPTHAGSPPQDPSRLFVVERGGTVRVVRDGATLPAPFLDLTGQVSTDGERGLLSIAFPPDHATSGLFYVYLTAASPLGELQVREYRRSADPDRADAATGRIVWRQAHPRTNHNGGQVQFGPDGLLWFATGDGGGQADPEDNAQDTSSHLGKVLRIDPRPSGTASYTVPADNPHGPVWALGLRNPFRFSFDRATGDLLIGDVGGGLREEIDWAPATEGRGRGANYGWPCREGTVAGPRGCAPGPVFTDPVFDYAQAGPRAVTGGFVVRDPGLPTLAGRYLYADTYAGQVRSLVLGRPATGDRAEPGLQRDLLVSFAEDACGRVYVVSLNGTVDRIQDGAASPCPPPAAAPAPVATPAAVDRSAPRVAVRVARGGRVGSRATPRIVLTANEACRVGVFARVAGARLEAVRTPLRAGRRTILRLRPSRRGARKIRRALRRSRRITLVVGVTARDAAGNTGRVKRRLRLRRG